MLCVDGLHAQAGAFAIREVSFSVQEGAYFVLLGASGVGKTVLLEALAGLLEIKAGRVTWNGEELTHARIQERGMGLVYQDQALFPHLTVRRNIAYGLRARGRSESHRRVEALADEVGVRHLLGRHPGTLSGGEAQRVALARAMATQPRCLLLDEPLSALDTHARAEMRALLRGLHRQGQAIIHVTHNYEEAVSLATEVAIMENGTVIQTGTPHDVFQHPKSEFVARFVGIRNVFPGVLEAGDARNPEVASFVSHGIRFGILTDAPPGHGLMVVRSEDVTLSPARPESSAQNCFMGKVTDVVPARLGVEVYVDVGVPVAALVTAGSVDRLGLHQRQDVWLSFKASAAQFIED